MYYTYMLDMMLKFKAADLQRNASEMQRCATRSPVIITHHDTPRFVLMSIEDFIQMSGGAAISGTARGKPKADGTDKASNIAGETK